MGDDARIEVRTRCNPSEVDERVSGAILALFPRSTISRNGIELFGSGDDGSALRAALDRHQIRGAFSGRLHRSIRGTELLFTLSKQAAFMGVPSLGVGHPLGDLVVCVHVADEDAAHRWVEWLTGGLPPLEIVVHASEE